MGRFLSRVGGIFGLGGAAPTTSAVGEAAAEGSEDTATRSDHTHGREGFGAAGYPVDVAAAESDGSAVTLARSDHRHAHGSGYLGDAHHAESHAARHETGGADLLGDLTLATILKVNANIQFPAAQVADAGANVLDDYEEGTWTPSLADDTLDGSGEGQTYDIQIGRYRKVGRTVHVWARLRLTSLGTLTTTQGARMMGLPVSQVNITSGTSGVPIGSCIGLAIGAGQSVGGAIGPNNAYVNLQLWDATGGQTPLLVSEVSATGDLAFEFEYQAG